MADRIPILRPGAGRGDPTNRPTHRPRNEGQAAGARGKLDLDISLRPVTRSDAAELIEANLASRGLHAPWLQPFTDQAGFEAWFARSVARPTIRLVGRESGGAVFGVVSISEIVLGRLQGAYLGYFAMAGFERRGLMTEAVRRAARFAFSELGLHRLEANIQPGNLRSIALVRRLGFREEGFSPEYLMIEGRWSDCERWALLARELTDDP